MNALYVPTDPDEVGADAAAGVFPSLAGSACLDVSGDGSPNNGLGVLLSTMAGFGLDANGEIANLLAEGAFHVLLHLGDDPEAAPFTLSGYLSKETDADGKYFVSPDSYKDGMPLIYFEGAAISAGELTLGPITFPLGDLLGPYLADAGMPPPDLALYEVRLQATVGAIDYMGIELTAGTLAGAVFKADLDMALYLARQWCATDPEAPADVCGPISMAEMALIETALTWDLEPDGCGKELNLYDDHDTIVGTESNCQAVSVCIFWSSEKAVIGGLAPAESE